MKTTKNLLILFAALGVMTTAIACQDSSQNSDTQDISVAAPVSDTTTQTSGTNVEGTYRCWQFNVNERILNTSSCRLAAPLVLAADGTYSLSSEHGTYTVSGDQIVLSESKIRGHGTLKEDNMQIYFKYTYNGDQYEMTYLRQ